MMLIPKFICLSDCDNIEGKNYIGSTMKPIVLVSFKVVSNFEIIQLNQSVVGVILLGGNELMFMGIISNKSRMNAKSSFPVKS